MLNFSSLFDVLLGRQAAKLSASFDLFNFYFWQLFVVITKSVHAKGTITHFLGKILMFCFFLMKINFKSTDQNSVK